jgi:exodeoxyribonuclease VII large subunit
MPIGDNTASGRDIYSVSRLNREARDLLENAFGLVWVEGEVSNLSCPSSGHRYFSLKDAGAQISCALFRNRGGRAGLRVEEGMQVLARGRVSLYEPRGGYQLIIEHLEESGDGALRRAFEQLKQRLYAEGLFDAAHKRPLPALARRVGVVTSPSGAAIRDVLTVFRRRFPLTEIIVYPTLVQGEGAAARIEQAIRTADRRAECDVVLLTRGGGSLEDLWPFNEERVARAVFDCTLPVVSAIGHEIDVVITDFVADRRAPTPSAAAELLSPDAADLDRTLAQARLRLERAQHKQLQHAGERLTWLGRRLDQQHPRRHLAQQGQRIDELEQRLRRAAVHRFAQCRARLQALQARLLQQTPRHRLARLGQHVELLLQRLRHATGRALEQSRGRLALAGRALDTVSPLATLERGYSITFDRATGRVLRDAAALAPGVQLDTRLRTGRVFSTVDAIET